jgi:hypothetical protein
VALGQFLELLGKPSVLAVQRFKNKMKNQSGKREKSYK